MPGDCHYLEGNLNAMRRIKQLRHVIDEIGLEAERVRMFNLSSAMAGGFVNAAEEMTTTIKQLGPNPLRMKLDGGMK